MRALGLLGMVGCLAASGCALGDGTGTLSGSLYLRGCNENTDYGSLMTPAAYNMNPQFFVADPINAPNNPLNGTTQLHPVNKLIIRVQTSGNRPDEADMLYLNIADDAQVAAEVGQAMNIGPTSVVRASLDLNQTCPNAEVEAELDGTMTWQAYGSATAVDGIQFGDRVAATFSFDVVDRRQIAIGGLGGVPTTPAAAGAVSGSFDFIVRQGKAAQSY